MNCHILFSRKNKKNISKYLLKFLLGVFCAEAPYLCTASCVDILWFISNRALQYQ